MKCQETCPEVCLLFLQTEFLSDVLSVKFNSSGGKVKNYRYLLCGFTLSNEIRNLDLDRSEV